MVETKEIVEAAGSDNLDERQTAFTKIVQDFQDMAFGCAYGIIGDVHLAQDAAQESFLVAYRDLQHLRNPEAFPGWFKQIVIRKAYRYAKLDDAVHMESPDETIPTDQPDSQQILIESETAEIVRTAISQLPDHERIVTVLFYLTGYSQNRIAAFLDLPLTTVKKRLQRAREHLRGRIEIVEKTLKNQKPSKSDDFASTLMDTIHAAEAGDITKIATMLEQNPDLARAKNERPSDVDYYSPGASALHYAAWAGQKEVAELLLDYGANIDLIDDAHSASPIGWANENDQSEMVDFLVKRGAKLNFRQAAMSNRIDVLEKLLLEDANALTFQDRNGSALHAAAAWGRLEVVTFLLEKGMDINIKSNAGRADTPLIRAAGANRAEIVEQLLAKGADKTLSRKDDKTALDLAEEKGHDSIVSLLSN
jgi:RNA polymerase sigma factor (sigma-70 family)